jgi:hypothetical protein
MPNVLTRLLRRKPPETSEATEATFDRALHYSPEGSLVPLDLGPDIRALPRPVRYVATPEPIVGREAPLADARAAVNGSQPVELYGQLGIGKSLLVHHLGMTAECPDGVALVSWGRRPLEELAVDLFSAFFDSTPKIVAGTLEHARAQLDGLDAILLLDDVEISQDDLRRLRDLVPKSRLLLVTERYQALAGVHDQELGGLTVEESIELLRSILGPEHPLEDDAKQLSLKLCGHPRRLRIAAHALRRPDRDALDAYVAGDRPLESVVAERCSEREQRVLAVLAFVDAPLTVETIAAITDLPDTAEVVADLEAKGLIERQSPTYGLTVNGSLLALPNNASRGLPGAALRALAHWTEQTRDNSERLALQMPAAVTALTRAGDAWPTETLRLALAIEHELSRSGRWDAWRVALEHAVAAATLCGEHRAKAFACHQLGARALCLGDPDAALRLLNEAKAEAILAGAREHAERSRYVADLARADKASDLHKLQTTEYPVARRMTWTAGTEGDTRHSHRPARAGVDDDRSRTGRRRPRIDETLDASRRDPPTAREVTMPTAGARTVSGPPFPLHELTSAPWREQALTKIGEQRFLLEWMSQKEGALTISDEIRRTIHDHWDAVEAAAKRRSRRGGSVERVTSHLNAVDADLLRLAPASYVFGQLPGLLERVQKCMPAHDLRRIRLEELVHSTTADLSERDRDLIVAARHAVATEARHEVTRLRSFRNVLLVTAAVLTIGVAAITVFAFVWPDKVPVCFSPEGSIVCTTSTTPVPGAGAEPGAAGQPSAISPSRIDETMRSAASGWDIAVVLGVGSLAAALAAVVSLRRIRGTSTPFGLPIALALLKLPTGALTAVLGLILMRGEFVPGLTALDSSGQIVAWAVVLGYSQQLLTRFVDQRAQTVLDNFGRTVAERHEPETARQRSSAATQVPIAP